MPTSRRALMRSTLAAGASLALPASAAVAQPAGATTSPATRKSDKPGLAVIGAGGIARWHGQYLSKHFNVAAVADVDRGRAESYNKDHAGGTALTTQDYRFFCAEPALSLGSGRQVLPPGLRFRRGDVCAPKAGGRFTR